MSIEEQEALVQKLIEQTTKTHKNNYQSQTRSLSNRDKGSIDSDEELTYF